MGRCPWERARAIPLPSKNAYEASRRRSNFSATTPDATSATVAARVIDSGAIGGPPVSASAVAVGLAVAVAVPVAEEEAADIDAQTILTQADEALVPG